MRALCIDFFFFFPVERDRTEADRYALHSLDVSVLRIAKVCGFQQLCERAASCNPSACTEPSGISFTVVLLTKF